MMRTFVTIALSLGLTLSACTTAAPNEATEATEAAIAPAIGWCLAVPACYGSIAAAFVSAAAYTQMTWNQRWGVANTKFTEADSYALTEAHRQYIAANPPPGCREAQQADMRNCARLRNSSLCSSTPDEVVACAAAQKVMAQCGWATCQQTLALVRTYMTRCGVPDDDDFAAMSMHTRAGC